MQKILEAIEAGKMTDEYEKTFIRKARTLMSVNKDTLHRQFNELYDRLKLFEDMYFEAFSKVDELFDTYDKDGELSAFITTHGAPVPLKLVTVTYAEDRLAYFEKHRRIARWAYEAAVSEHRNDKGSHTWASTEVDDAGRTLQFYDDVVAMLKAEMEKQEAAKCEND